MIGRTRLAVRPNLLFVAVLLASCATGDARRLSPTLIIEGNDANYPAFDAAAKDCGYTAYQLFPGAAVPGLSPIGPHLNLARVDSRAAICAIRWVSEHPEAGLEVSGH